MPFQRVYIIDDDCGEDESHQYDVDAEVDPKDIITAIHVFYPTATSFTIEAVDGEVGDE